MFPSAFRVPGPGGRGAVSKQVVMDWTLQKKCLLNVKEEISVNKKYILFLVYETKDDLKNATRADPEVSSSFKSVQLLF